MKKSCDYIKLKQGPIMNNCYGHEASDGCHFDNQTEGVKKVENLSLSKTLSYQTCLISLNKSIGMKFEFESPSATNDLFVLWQGNKVPCVCPYEGMQFTLNCFTLVHILDNFLIKFWFSHGSHVENVLGIRSG